MIVQSSELLTFAIATAAITATPGVSVSAVSSTSIAHGMKSGFAMEFGVEVGRLSMLILLALGLEAVSEFMSFAFVWIKWLGAAYLVWIGIKTIMKPPVLQSQATQSNASLMRQAINGFFILWGNPKAFLFFGVFLPQFITTSKPVLPQIAVLGVIWLSIALATDSVYIFLAGSARRAVMNNEKSIWLGRLSGSMLIGAGVWLATQQKA